MLLGTQSTCGGVSAKVDRLFCGNFDKQYSHACEIALVFAVLLNYQPH